MATAIIAGIPRDIQRRVKHALETAPKLPVGWAIKWLPSKNSVPGLAPSQAADAMEMAAAHDGAHLLLFTGRPFEVDRQVRDQIRPHFRVRKLSNHLLAQVPHRPETFIGAMVEVLEEEAQWDATVRPRTETSCVLLPECSFEADGPVRNVWALAFEQDTGRIRAAADAQMRFEAAHWRHVAGGNRRWTDRQGRIFGHSGPRHAIALFPENWKLSYRVPDGFHFDVTHNEGRQFTVRDRLGTQHRVGATAHLNLDPHGRARA